jgi:hypothetical protein
MNLSSSPNSYEFPTPPIVDNLFEKAQPLILTYPFNDMEFTNNIIMVYQYPPENKLFVPTYISADYQTHYAIYKYENGELNLLFEKLQIVFEGLVYYYLDREITNFLYELGLNKDDIQRVKNKKYKLDVIEL